MRRAVLVAITVGGVALPLVAGTALASAKDGRDRVGVPAGGGAAFELRIDPELDERFGPRPVNAAQAVVIATDRFGGQAVRAELDEENGRPIWEIGLAGGSVGEVDVDAVDGEVLRSEAGDD